MLERRKRLDEVAAAKHGAPEKLLLRLDELSAQLAKELAAGEGLYKASGFFTRFDGHGRWQTVLTPDGPHALQGPYFIHNSEIRFTLAGNGETPFDWKARFSQDCETITLEYAAHTGQPDIHFSRVKR